MEFKQEGKGFEVDNEGYEAGEGGGRRIGRIVYLFFPPSDTIVPWPDRAYIIVSCSPWWSFTTS